LGGIGKHTIKEIHGAMQIEKMPRKIAYLIERFKKIPAQVKTSPLLN
jgi:uncharacterized coiled-coil protein SlyX